VPIRRGKPRGMTVTRIVARNSTVRVRVVERRDIFPGLRDGFEPLIVVNRDALRNADPFVIRSEEVWTTQSSARAAKATLDRADILTFSQRSPASFLSSSGLLPITWIFQYLRALAVLIGLVALAGLVFALAARTRRRTASYVLARRMGLHKRAFRRSMAVELTAVLGMGWIVGAGFGLIAVATVYRMLDPDLTDPPSPALAIPVATLVGTLLVTITAVTLGALITQYFADRADPASVMRLE